MIRCLIPSTKAFKQLILLVTGLLFAILPLWSTDDAPNDSQGNDINFLAEKPDEISVSETAKTKEPDIFGVLYNTHWDIAVRYVTHYLSKGLILDADSLQSEMRLSFDNPCFAECYESRLFLDNFNNFPTDSPLRELDYAIGATMHLFDIFEKIKIGIEVAYNYYTYPGPPQAPYQPVNRQNEFDILLNAKWDKFTVQTGFYYELAFIQTSTLLTLIYETPLNDVICCASDRLSFLGTLGGGYINTERPNGDQHNSNGFALVNFYSYIQAGGYLKYTLNKCTKLQTGILYTANNASNSNYQSEQSAWTWNVIEFDVTY